MAEVTTKGKVTTTVRAIVRHILCNYEGAELESMLIDMWEDTIAAERVRALNEAIGIARLIETGQMTGTRTAAEAIETHKRLTLKD